MGRPCGHFVRSAGPTHPLDRNIQTATSAWPGSASTACSRTWSTARVHCVRLLCFGGGLIVAAPRTGQGRPRGEAIAGTWDRSCGCSVDREEAVFPACVIQRPGRKRHSPLFCAYRAQLCAVPG